MPPGIFLTGMGCPFGRAGFSDFRKAEPHRLSRRSRHRRIRMSRPIGRAVKPLARQVDVQASLSAGGPVDCGLCRIQL
jgi:hypothetical protein